MSLPTLQELTTAPIVLIAKYDKTQPPCIVEGKIYAYDKEHFYNWLGHLHIEVEESIK